MVAFPQGDDEISGGGFFRLCFLTSLESDKKRRIQITSKVMTENFERAAGVPEGFGGIGRGETLNEVGPERLVNALSGCAWLQKEALALAYA
jgi:hypothetical protein